MQSWSNEAKFFFLVIAAVLGMLTADIAMGQPYCKPGFADRMGITKIRIPHYVSWVHGYSIGRPEHIYCSRSMVKPLAKVFQCLKDRSLEKYIRTFNGCYCYRNKINRNPAPELSNHAYGTAIDINASTNGYGRTPQMNQRVVRCFKENGFTWGGDWRVPDGMHFQLKNSPMRGTR